MSRFSMKIIMESVERDEVRIQEILDDAFCIYKEQEEYQQSDCFFDWMTYDDDKTKLLSEFESASDTDDETSYGFAVLEKNDKEKHFIVFMLFTTNWNGFFYQPAKWQGSLRQGIADYKDYIGQFKKGPRNLCADDLILHVECHV